jgi:hypothetical protein
MAHEEEYDYEYEEEYDKYYYINSKKGDCGGNVKSNNNKKSIYSTKHVRISLMKKENSKQLLLKKK